MKILDKETDQLNFFSTPISTIERFNDFMHKYKKAYKTKVTQSNIGAMLLEVGLDVCEKELEQKIKSQNVK